MAGMFIFPPLAVVGGIFSVFSGLGGAEKWSRRITRIQESSLHPGEIAPGTAVEGTVYIPATTTQDALIVFYSVDGRTQTLNMPRAATRPQEVR